MNIYLCGQRWFGEQTFHLIRDAGHTIVGVSAPPARADGAEDRLWRIACDVPRLPAGMLNAETIPAGVDLIVAAHSHDFIGRKTRLRARIGALGYHPSLLPLHRGRDAVEWTVRMRDRVAGGSIYWLSDTVDGGPIAAQEHVLVRPGDTAAALWRRDLGPLGLRLLGRALADVAAGRLVRIPQDHTLATWEPSLDPPRLYRPDLALIGPGLEGFRTITTKEDADAGQQGRHPELGAAAD